MMKKVLTINLMLACLASSAIGMALPDNASKSEPSGCNYAGEHFELNSFSTPNPCLYIECDNNGTVEVLQAECEAPKCDLPKWQPDRCCPVCPKDEPISYAGCKYRGEFYLENDHIRQMTCKRCICYRGQIYCVSKMCQEVYCADWILSTDTQNETNCCRECPNGYSCAGPGGLILLPGESVTVEGYVCECPEKPWQGLCKRPNFEN